MRLCQNDHAPIAYEAPNGERCPLCAAQAEIDRLTAKLEAVEEEAA